MNFMLDSINLDDIGFAHKHFAICGVTSNPSIIKKEGNVDLVFSTVLFMGQREQGQHNPGGDSLNLPDGW